MISIMKCHFQSANDVKINNKKSTSFIILKQIIYFKNFKKVLFFIFLFLILY